MKNILPKECLRTLYYVLIDPHITYGTLAWGNANSCILKRSGTLQKRAMRLIHNAPYNGHTDPLFKSSGILKLSDILEYQSIMFMYDFLTNELPLSYGGCFVKNSDLPGARSTRQSDLFHVPRCQTNFASKLPVYQMPRAWNKYARLFADLPRKSTVKNTMKNHFLTGYSENIKCNNTHCRDCQPK